MQRKTIFSYVTIMSVSIFFNIAVAAAPAKYNDLSILVLSCDKYAQFWQPFFKLLDRHWPSLNAEHKDVPIYLLANSKHYANQRIQMINVPNEISWADNVITALNSIHSKYVLVFLDDYWLNSAVNEPRFAELLNLMRKQDAAYLQLFADAHEEKLSRSVPGVTGIVYKGKFQKYRASLQLAIWETKALQQILRSGESAWDFEMAASIRSSGYPKDFYTLQQYPPIVYINASHQGHITPKALNLAQQIDPNYVSVLPVLNDKNWDLKFKHAKHRVETIASAIKRNVGDADTESYRYTYENRD